MRLFFLLTFLLCTTAVQASVTLDSVLTKAGKVEIRRKDEDSDPAIYVSNKMLHQLDRSPAYIYAVFRPDGKYGDELVLVTDCGADNCDFRIVLVAENKKIRVTNEFGNGNDRPSVSYEKGTLLLDFGERGSDKKRTIVKFSSGKITTSIK